MRCSEQKQTRCSHFYLHLALALPVLPLPPFFFPYQRNASDPQRAARYFAVLWWTGLKQNVNVHVRKWCWIKLECTSRNWGPGSVRGYNVICLLPDGERCCQQCCFTFFWSIPAPCDTPACWPQHRDASHAPIKLSPLHSEMWPQLSPMGLLRVLRFDWKRTRFGRRLQVQLCGASDALYFCPVFGKWSFKWSLMLKYKSGLIYFPLSSSGTEGRFRSIHAYLHDCSKWLLHQCWAILSHAHQRRFKNVLFIIIFWL